LPATASTYPNLVQAAVSPTFGKTTIGTLTNTGGAGYLEVSGPYTSPAGCVTKLTAYIAGGNAPQPMRAVVYADNGASRPGNFVAVSTQVTIGVSQAAGWVDFSLASSVCVTAGQYWLGFWYGATKALEYYDTLAGAGRYVAAPYSATANPPASFGTGSGSSNQYSVYATLG
jgi:hypothetical protein